MTPFAMVKSGLPRNLLDSSQGSLLNMVETLAAKMKKWIAPSNSWKKTNSNEYKLGIFMAPSNFYP